VPGVALALWSLFGALALMGRGLLQVRLTGSFGIVGIARAQGWPERFGGVLFVSALLLGITAPILDLTGIVSPIAALDVTAVHVVGLCLFALGFGGTLYAQLAMGASWRIGVDPSERTALVTSGPFGLVRNPIYSAMLPTLAGLALLSPSMVALLAFALLVVALEIQVRAVEEPYLVRAHGRDYASYAARVGRFVPGIGRIRGYDGSP
jgi:protein-S-isoprenylcysteine O-methyltransferase Ste14